MNGILGTILSILLIQVGNPNGRQTYLPGWAMNLGSRLIAAGIRVFFGDQNHDNISSGKFREMLRNCEAIGISILGPPYVPGACETIEAIRAMGFRQPILIGGEGIARVSQEDFACWFGQYEHVYHVFADEETDPLGDARLAALLGKRLVPEGAVSMVPMLQQLSAEQRRLYLTREFPLYLSRGCAYDCDFCAAFKFTKEQYRSFGKLLEELYYICEQLTLFGHDELCCYVSNLDSLQSLDKFDKAMAVIGEMTRQFGLRANVRSLATINFGARAAKQPEVLKRLHDNGLQTIAFGADGADEKTWEREGKTHNTLKNLYKAIAATQAAGITVEILMVIGFQGDNLVAAGKALALSFVQAAKGCIIRPYLGKSRLPSVKERWTTDEVKPFQKHRELLLNLDYAALGSAETHPNRGERWLSNLVYLLIIGVLAPFGKCPTSPLLPVPLKGIGRWIAQRVNRWMPFDR